jgi:hypothetical protein
VRASELRLLLRDRAGVCYGHIGPCWGIGNPPVGRSQRFIARFTRPFVVQVTVASCSGNLKFVASRGLKIEADKLVSECAEDQWDAIVVPGVRAVVSGASPVRFTVGGCVQVGCQARRTSQRMPLQCQSCSDSTHSRSWSLRYARHL